MSTRPGGEDSPQETEAMPAVVGLGGRIKEHADADPCVSSIQKENSEMVGDSHSNFVRCSRSKRRKMLKPNSDLDSLPDDTVKEILLRIPAQDILDFTMFVCRKWYQMIRNHEFLFSHLHHSTPGLLIRNLNNERASFMSMTRSGQIEISKFRYQFRHRVWSSCHGLVLELKSSDEFELIITNPLTNQNITIPPFFIRTLHPNSNFTMVYVANQMGYKVVRTYYLGVPSPQSPAYCAILTVDVDHYWRLVDTQHLSLTASQLLNMCPLVTEGFVHWAEDWHYNYVLLRTNIITQMSNQFVLTMNTETEAITHIAAPQCNGGYYYYKYLSGGTCLSLLIGRGYLKWEVWEMKPETGEWTKLPDIDLEAHRSVLNESYDAETGSLKPGVGDCLDCKLLPDGWLKYPDVIVFVTYRPTRGGSFRQARLRVVYNVPTQKISLFLLDYHCHPYIDHRNSLIGKC